MSAPAPAGMPTSRPKFIFFLALMVLIWSVNFVIAKIALRHFPPLALALFRPTLATIFVLLLFWPLAPRSTQFQRSDWRKFVELGIYGVILNQSLFVLGLSRTSVAHASVIVSLSPVLVLAIARLRGLEKFTAAKVLGLAMSFLGVAILSSEHGVSFRSPTLLGDLLTLTASTAFAYYTVAGKEVAERYSSLAMNTYSYMVAAILIMPFTVWQALVLDWHAVSTEGWLSLVYMALFASALAYLIYYWALRQISATRAAMLGYLQPVLATCFGVAFLAEHLSTRLLMGGAIVLVGVYIAECRE